MWCLKISLTASSVRSGRLLMSLRLFKISYFDDAAAGFEDACARSQAEDDRFVELVAKSGADIFP